MKKAFLVIALLWTAAIQAQNNEAAIRRLLQQQTEAWNRGDLEAFMQTYWQSDSLIFIGSNGVNHGWKKALEHYEESYPNKDAMGSLSFEIIEIKKLSGEYFFVTGKWMLRRKQDNPSGYYTLLIRKIRGQWRIVADHSS